MIEANPFGPLITPENVIFRLWAPGAKRVELMHRQNEIRRSGDGWSAHRPGRKARRPLPVPHRR